MDKPKAVICDLDGTLALFEHHRKPYGEETAKCVDDECNIMVERIVNALATQHDIIVVSGREEAYRAETIYWLRAFYIPYKELYMRAAGDYRPDNEIKREIYEKHIKPNYDVKLCIDDRPRVIRTWRELGLDVLDVGNGEEF